MFSLGIKTIFYLGDSFVHMTEFEIILNRLNRFTNRYYTRLLIKGGILFLSFGVLLFLLITGIEYFLWLNGNGRLVLLVVLVLVEVFLLYKWILTPILYLFKVKKGLSHKDASILIGKHFSEVNDKLANLLDLSNDKNKSDLLLASIEQKSSDLKRVEFGKAVDFTKTLSFFKYAVIPIVLILLLLFSGEFTSFFSSYKRVKNYDIAYAPPAPFEFLLLNEELNFLEDEEVVIELKTTGKVKPEKVFLNHNGNQFVMENSNGRFRYTLGNGLSSGVLFFEANGYRSQEYELMIGKVPSIDDFEMQLVFPRYLSKSNETLKGTGNAIIPEGTQVTWKLNVSNTEAIGFVDRDSTKLFKKSSNEHVFSKSVFSNLDYSITTSNQNSTNHETLGYRLEVVKDAHPSILIEQQTDSLTLNSAQYAGQVSDDQKVRTVRVVYAPVENPKNESRVTLFEPNAAVSSFEYEFPNRLNIEKGIDYQLYFEVVDNDALRGGKISRSKTFLIHTYDGNQLKNKELESYKSVLNQFQNNVQKLSEQEAVLKEINNTQKQKDILNYDDKSEVKQFLQNQKQQEEMMKKFSQELKKNLERQEKEDEMSELLKERLLRQELEAKKNEKLLEELEKIADKIDKEELQKKLEELAKKQGSNKRNLEQLLELTKRYYVTEKANQLSEQLVMLSAKQKLLSEVGMDEKFNTKEQRKINEEYGAIDKELDQLKRDNQDLKKPLDLDIDENLKKGIKEDQGNALDEINKHQGNEESSQGSMPENAKNGVKQKMKSSSDKMQQLGKSLQQGASMSGGSTIAEDAEMLRQILDNLITFSFKQEALFDVVSSGEDFTNQFSGAIKKQQELRKLFEHVDDSLFSLSLRRAELAEFVNEQITEVYYNVDKALESIADNRNYQGASYQQYVLTAANNLADFLADALSNMQQSMMPGQGQGQGDGFQLPDIIKAQQSLGDKMGQKSGQGSKGNETGNQGEKGKQDNGQGKGESGKQGDNGTENGNNGQGGQKGGDKNGNGNQNGQGDGGVSESDLQELFEIYKEQQTIRQRLEQQLSTIIDAEQRDLAKKIALQMEQFENDLIQNGITQRTINKLNTIQHQLLKLENAALQHGQKKQRESETNTEVFDGVNTKSNAKDNPSSPTIEILNRDVIPLRQEFQKKVKGYFEKENRF